MADHSVFTSEGCRLYWRVLHHGAEACEIDHAIGDAKEQGRLDGLEEAALAIEAADRAYGWVTTHAAVIRARKNVVPAPPPEPPEPRGGKETKP